MTLAVIWHCGPVGALIHAGIDPSEIMTVKQVYTLFS